MLEQEAVKPHSGQAIPIVHAPCGEATRLGEISSQQWKSGMAAWLGWLFDGLDMHLYTLVAAPFVAELLGGSSPTDPAVGYYSSLIQAAFLVGWALGGGFFGRIGDRIGRSRALMLTILTYALFTGLSFFAQTWWHLLIFRFLAALGIGGEWAVGRVAAFGNLAAAAGGRGWRPCCRPASTSASCWRAWPSISWPSLPPRYVFLVGVLPALLVLWIRRAVPETEGVARGERPATRRSPPRFSTCFAARAAHDHPDAPGLCALR